MAQLVEQSFLTPEIQGLAPSFVKILSTNCAIVNTKKRKGGPGIASHKKCYLKVICSCANKAAVGRFVRFLKKMIEGFYN